MTDDEKCKATKRIVETLIQKHGSLILPVRPWATWQTGRVVHAAFGYPLPRNRELVVAERVSREKFLEQYKEIQSIEPELAGKKWKPTSGETYWKVEKAK